MEDASAGANFMIGSEMPVDPSKRRASAEHIGYIHIEGGNNMLKRSISPRAYSLANCSSHIA